MNPTKQSAVSLLAGCALGAALWCAPAAKANVFASNIKLNGALASAKVNQGSGVTISYILNEPATLGTTLNILSGTNVVRSYSFAAGSPGALMGPNIVTWDCKNTGGSNVATGTYAITITAAASGFTNWTQTSIDTNAGMPAFFPRGIDVDKNTNSPYYGRVVMSCALHGGSATNVPVAAQKDGLFKMNADGSQADEGWYGNANYLNDDGGDGPVAGQMPNSGGFNPLIVRIGEDDRIYWCDNTFYGAIIAADMQATTHQIVLSEPNYITSPVYSTAVNDGGIGFRLFDVTGTTTQTNAALWLADNDYPNFGIWMFHLTNGVCDTNDTLGNQAVTTGNDLQLVSSGGVTVDDNLDIFIGQARSSDSGANADYYAMAFTNWNGGVLPPENAEYTYTTGTAPGQVSWGYGTGVDMTGLGDPTFENVVDVAIDSKVHPTKVACPMTKGADNNGGGIRVLDAVTGNLIAVTNGVSVQTLTNLDWGQQYTSAAWDGVGNLYGVSTTLNLWRVWSPPGTNQSTTMAVETVNVVTPVVISSIALSGSMVTIDFTGPAGASASAFTLVSSAAVAPASGYTPVGGAVITALSPGVFQATAATSGSAAYYRIKQ